MFSNRSNPPLCQVSMFNTSPISRKCDITVRTCKLLRHIIPLEEIDRNCLQLSYALFFGLIHISLTFSERDVGTALSYRDKNHFGASISRKTNFKSSIWKWQRRHFRKLLEVARFSLRDVTMAKIVRTNKLPSSPPPLNHLQWEKYCNYPPTTTKGDRFASCENIVPWSQTSSLAPCPQFIIGKLNPFVVVDFRFICAFLHA